MKSISILTLTLGFLSFSTSGYAQEWKYKDASVPTEVRVKDLLGRMTLEEKVGQLCCPMGWTMYEKDGKKLSPSDIYQHLVKDSFTGMYWATFRADPWTKKTLENGLSPKEAAKVANQLQKYALEHTRLGIPVFLAEEAAHGHMAIGTTVFPTGIGQAATFNPDIVRKMGSVIAREVRLQGAHIAYGPVLDLVRDPRWSRVEETFGEDPYLSSTLGTAMVEGMGGGNLSQPYAVISTLKHFVGYGAPEGGHNGSPTVVGKRDLFENYLPPFRKAVEAGALSVMTSYNSMDGVPSTMNGYMLKDILRTQWGFRGFTISDLFSIEGIKDSHRIVKELDDAARLAMTAGVDVDLGGEAYRTLLTSVRSGEVAEAVVDTAVARVLRLKFEMGLFDNPYVDADKAQEGVRNQESIALAREVARQSVVLLENKNNILPLKKDCRVAVIGPNADNMYNMLGDYTAPQEEDNVVTVLEGILGKLSSRQVTYAKGCAIRDTSLTDIESAVRAAKNADVAVVVVGGSSARDFKTTYKETGAAIASEDYVSDMECGEGFDRSSLRLLGDQLELLKAVKQTGTPVIVVYIQGRPLDMNWAAAHADALLTAWYPGQEGGNAIADVLFGDYNPSGRLPMSVPKHEGQIPVYYNRLNPTPHNYVESDSSPLYAFGYGKSYTSFEYANLSVERKGQGYCVAFDLKNTGKCDGTEVVQLYLRDEYATMVRPQKQLKAFRHVTLKAGESRRVSFDLSKDDFAMLDADLHKVVEPGEFTVMAGAASDDIRLQSVIEWND